MRRSRTAMAVVAVMSIALQAQIAVPPASARTTFHVAHTFSYHQITSTLNTADEYRNSIPVISGNGQVVAFSAQTASHQPYVVDMASFTGALGSEVDTWPFSGAPDTLLAIDDEGESVISSDHYQLRVAAFGGTAGTQLLRLNGQEISQIALSGDGSTAFFIVRRDTQTSAGQQIPRGLWSISTGGSCLTQLASADKVATQLSLQPGDIFPFDTDVGSTLSVSKDGTKAVFSTMGAGQGYVFTWAGSACSAGAIKRLLGPPPPGPGFPKIWHTGIDPSGEQVAYDIGGSERTIGVVNFDGTGGETLNEGPVAPNEVDYLQLGDEKTLLLGSSGLLLDTTPGSTDFLNLNTSNQMSNSLMSGTYAMTMDDAADRYTYLYKDKGGKYQVAGLKVDGGQGTGPSITAPAISPAYVRAGKSPAALQVKVTYDGKLNYVIPSVLIEQTTDPDSFADLHKAKHSIYKGSITAYGGAEIGPRTVAIEAQANVDGQLLATQIEITPFQVKK